VSESGASGLRGLSRPLSGAEYLGELHAHVALRARVLGVNKHLHGFPRERDRLVVPASGRQHPRLGRATLDLEGAGLVKWDEKDPVTAPCLYVIGPTLWAIACAAATFSSCCRRSW
jgi:hypothetical protein